MIHNFFRKTEVAKFQATRKATPIAIVQVDQDRAHLTLRDRHMTRSPTLARQEAVPEAAREASQVVEVDLARDQDRMIENRERTKIKRNRGETADQGKRI